MQRPCWKWKLKRCPRKLLGKEKKKMLRKNSQRHTRTSLLSEVWPAASWSDLSLSSRMPLMVRDYIENVNEPGRLNHSNAWKMGKYSYGGHSV